MDAQEPQTATTMRSQTRAPASAQRRVFVAAVRALVVTALLAGAAGEPRSSSAQTAAASPYRVVLPEGSGPHPALLFVSGCSGFTPHESPRHYGRMAEEFAARGFVVIFVDYLGARGREVCGGMVRPNDVAGDILAAAEFARARPFVQASDISVIGWSMGGGGALEAIARLAAGAPVPFRAAVAYYPECYGVGTPWQAKVPLLLLLAGQDDYSPTRACQELIERVGRDFPIEVRLYPSARHGFDVAEFPPLFSGTRGRTLGHDPQAAAAAREEVRQFLGR